MHPSKEKHPINKEAKLIILEDQVGIALAYDADEDLTLTAKQVWDLINPNLLDTDKANDPSP